MTPLARKVLELFGKPETVQEGNPKPSAESPCSSSWTCPHCEGPATIEDVFPSLDGERTLTMWRCDPCQVVAVTPDAIRQPPVWIARTEQ